MAQTAPAKDATAHALDEDDAFEVPQLRGFRPFSHGWADRSLKRVSDSVAWASRPGRLLRAGLTGGEKKEFTRAQVNDDQRAWAEDWDDDEVDDAFSKQLRAELTKSGHVQK